MKTITIFFFLYLSTTVFSQTYLGNGVTDWGAIGDSSTTQKTAFVIDNSNNKWIGTFNDGLYKFDNSVWTKFDTSNSGLPSNRINCLYAYNNFLYIGTNSGLAVYDGTWVTYNTTNSGLPNNNIRTVYYYNNKLWVATFSGLSKFDGANWTTFTSSNYSLLSSYIRSITNTPDGKICLASSKGLIYYNDTIWTADTTIKNIICVKYDLSGNLWFSTSGINEYNISIDNVYKRTATETFSFDQLVPQGYIIPRNVKNFSINSSGYIYFLSSQQKTIYKFSATGINYYYIDQIQSYYSIDSNDIFWFLGGISEQQNLYSLSNESTAQFSNPIFANLDTNNVRALYWSSGSMFWDMYGTAKYEVPKNSGKTSLFANGLWIGGLDDSGQLHFAGEKYRSNGADYFTGPIMDSVLYYQEQNNWNKIWKINRNDIIYHILHYNNVDYIIPQSIVTWSGNGDTSKGQQFRLAPYKDVNNNQIYDPQNGDFPTIYGDQAVFFIINDAKANHTETNGTKLGIEIHGMAYAFNISENDAFYNTTFLKYKIFNLSNTNYHDVYIGNWNDIDLGYYNDDYIGCDVQRSSYFGYNGNSIDGNGQPWAYGANPPAQSVTFLGASMPHDGFDNPANIDYGINGYGFGDNIIDNERYGMCRFSYFNNGTCTDICDPLTADQYYNYLKGFWKDGLPVSYGGTGYDATGINIPCKFMFPGNSDSLHWGTNYQTPAINSMDWQEDTMHNPMADRRGVGSVGPITLQAGEMQEYDLAFVWGQDLSKSTGKYDQLLNNIDTIRKYFTLGQTPTGQPFETYVSEELKRDDKIYIYPNPTNNYLNIETNTLERTTYTVYDYFGRSIKTGILFSNFNIIDVSNFSKGVYLLVLNKKNTITKKFIKQ